MPQNARCVCNHNHNGMGKIKDENVGLQLEVTSIEKKLGEELDGDLYPVPSKNRQITNKIKNASL